jgi:hypothetical protein
MNVCDLIQPAAPAGAMDAQAVSLPHETPKKLNSAQVSTC